MKEKLLLKFGTMLIALFLFLSLLSCSDSPGKIDPSSLNFPNKPDPRSYVCYRTTVPVNADGILDEKSWGDVQWTDFFVDIEGSAS